MDDQIEMFPTAAKAHSTSSGQARDAGLAKVRDNSGEWFPRALALFDRFRSPYRGQCLTGEAIRQLLEPAIGPPPNHVNAYGSLVRTMAHYEWIVDTGDRVKAKTINSHAREVRVWRVL